MPEPTSQTFDELVNAELFPDITKALTLCVAEAYNITNRFTLTSEQFADHLSPAIPQRTGALPDNLQTVKEYAAIHNISSSTARQRIRDNKLDTHRRHGRVFIVDRETPPPADRAIPAAQLQPVHSEILKISALLNQNENPHAADFYTSALRLFFPIGQHSQHLISITHDTETIHRGWKEAREYDITIPHPLRHAIRIMLQRRPITDTRVNHVDDLAPISYINSEIIRTDWMPLSDATLETITVDGEPFTSKLSTLPSNFTIQHAKIHIPKQTDDFQLQLALETPRKPNTFHSHILIGFETFGGKLNASTARDIATLLILINITNTDLILTPEDLGKLLARHRNGDPRSPETSDQQRGINAWTALHGALFFCKTERGLIEPYPLVKSDRSLDKYILGAPEWLKELKRKQHTLSAGIGHTGNNRFLGTSKDGGIWRFIYGVEYYLARKAKKRGNSTISDLLVPADHKKSGPGKWEILPWHFLLELGGERWDKKNPTKHDSAGRKFRRFVENAKKAEYAVSSLSTNAHAPAGDTIEFYFGKKGVVYARATDRFTEAYRKSTIGDWETTSLSDYLRL